MKHSVHQLKLVAFQVPLMTGISNEFLESQRSVPKTDILSIDNQVQVPSRRKLLHTLCYRKKMKALTSHCGTGGGRE